jgi:hypothetical protein
MTYLAAIVSVVLFGFGLKWTRAAETAGDAIAIARSALATLLDARLSDDEKERAARASSLRLVLASARILGGFALAAGTALAFLVVLVATRVVGLAALVAVAESWTFIAFSAIVVTAALWWRR